MSRALPLCCLLSCLLPLAGCRDEAQEPPPWGDRRMRNQFPALEPALVKTRWQISSPAFARGAAIPRQYTCAEADLSPPLAWTAPPAGTGSLALVMATASDPRGSFTHWVLFDLAPGRRSLPEGVAKDTEVPGVGMQGNNGLDGKGYSGPCPPAGETYSYVFHLFALRRPPRLKPGDGRSELEAAMKDNLLAITTLTGTFRAGS